MACGTMTAYSEGSAVLPSLTVRLLGRGLPSFRPWRCLSLSKTAWTSDLGYQALIRWPSQHKVTCGPCATGTRTAVGLKTSTHSLSESRTERYSSPSVP